MKIIRAMTLVAATSFAVPVVAGDLTLDSAIGGAVGGAVGGAIGAELGGREGAIVGSGIGAAAGVAINTSDHKEPEYHREPEYRHEVYSGERYYRDSGHSHPSRFCPPGQAKKGRC